jgi:hypothetical protein
VGGQRADNRFGVLGWELLPLQRPFLVDALV